MPAPAVTADGTGTAGSIKAPSQTSSLGHPTMALHPSRKESTLGPPGDMQFPDHLPALRLNLPPCPGWLICFETGSHSVAKLATPGSNQRGNLPPFHLFYRRVIDKNCTDFGYAT